LDIDHSFGQFVFQAFLRNVRRLYEIMGIPYFQFKENQRTLAWILPQLLSYFREGNGQAAESAKRIMMESCDFWTNLVDRD
jgi:hypothetical protein